MNKKERGDQWTLEQRKKETYEEPLEVDKEKVSKFFAEMIAKLKGSK